MSLPQVVRQYARALYAAARDAQVLPSIERDMDAMDELFERLPEVAAWCRGRPRGDTAPVLVREAFLPLVGPLTGRALMTAAEQGRLAALVWLPEAFRREAEAAGGAVRVRLESAQAPEPVLIDSVAARVSERSGRRALVEVAVVPELTAGFRVVWNDRMVDRSVRGRLGALRVRLASGDPS